VKREEFDQLVRDLEERAAKNPKGFLWRVGALAAFAYAYIVGVALLMVVLTASCVAVTVLFPNPVTLKLGLGGAIFFGSMSIFVVSSLWVKLSPPEGIKLVPMEVPELFAMLRGLEDELGAPRFHEVLLVGDNNAAVVQLPRLGVFGWYKNYLLLGLPLMQGLGPEEFKSVLAHELGHLSGGHGRFGNWLYRMRRSWEFTFHTFNASKNNAFVGMVTGFMNWYWPKFNAHAFVLSRVNEYEADATAARLTSPSSAANALVRVRVQAFALGEHFWPMLFRRANTDPVTPGDLYAQMGHFLQRDWPAEDLKRWLKASFLIQTNNQDTHPCLRDRLRGLDALPPGVEAGDFPAELPARPSISAAEAFLGKSISNLVQGLTDQWRENFAVAWSERHRHAKSLAIAQAPPSLPTATDAEKVESLWQRAKTLMDLEGDEAAFPLLEEIRAVKPDHAGACFSLGVWLLSKDDARGVALMESAMQLEENLESTGLELLYIFYSRTGQSDQLRPLENRMDHLREMEAAAGLERGTILATDTFLPHELSQEQIEPLRKTFLAFQDIGEVWIAQKKVKVFPKSPCYVLAVKIRFSWWKLRSDTANQTLIAALWNQVSLPGSAYVFSDENDQSKVAKALRRVPGSLVYQKMG
jgi:Zn-dependent protease with chaperone function